MPANYTITLLRHGQSEGNAQGLFQGQMDYPLTELGREQARTRAEEFHAAGVTFDQVIASPLGRARETGQIIADRLGAPLKTDPLWVEQDLGALSSLSFDAWMNDPARPPFFTPYSKAGQTGESRIELFARAHRAAQSLFANPPGSYLIASHEAFLNAAIFTLLGMPPHASIEGPRFNFHNAGFFTLRYREELHRWDVLDASNPPLPPDLEAPYLITAVRHGESVGNANGYWQGQADFPLTERGRAQARALAERWLSEGRTFDHVLASPLSRARETAEILCGALGLPIEYDEVWLERNNGLHAGLKPEEALARHPRPDFIHPHHPMGGTGETLWEVYLRGGRALFELLQRPPGRYLIVSHGGILNRFLYAILGITPQANDRGAGFLFRNTAFATLAYAPELNRWHVLGLNDRRHWNGQAQE